jgi:hypothetical protein
MKAIQRIMIDLDSIERLPMDALGDISVAANDPGMVISHGIAAIGSILASAARNDEIGLNAGTVADLGYLLQSLGKLSSHTANIEGRAGTHHRRRVAEGT